MWSGDRKFYLYKLLLSFVTIKKEKDEAVHGEGPFRCSPPLVRLKGSVCDAERWGWVGGGEPFCICLVCGINFQFSLGIFLDISVFNVEE